MKTEKIEVKMTPELKTQFDRACRKNHANRSAVVRSMIQHYIDENELGINDLIEAKYDQIMAAVSAAAARLEGLDPSWHIDIEIDPETGEISSTAPLTQNSQSRASWEGETVIVASIQGWTVEDYTNLEEDILAVRDNGQELLDRFAQALDSQPWMGLQAWLEENHPRVLEEIEDVVRGVAIHELIPEDVQSHIQYNFLDVVKKGM